MKWNRMIKRPICFLLAITLYLSVFLPQQLSAQSAALPALPSNSGKIILDQDSSNGYEGDYVLIENTGPSGTLESTGLLQGLSAGRMPNLKAIEESQQPFRLDYHPAPVIPNGGSLGSKGRSASDYQEGQIAQFNIQRIDTGVYSKQPFRVLVNSRNCYIWVPVTQDTAHTVTFSMGQQIAQAFEDGYSDMTSSFGQFLNVDGTGKVSILLYDIQCGNNPSGYVGGFFASSDLYGDTPAVGTILDSGALQDDPLDSGFEQEKPLDSGVPARERSRSGSSGNGMQILHIDTYPSIFRSNGYPYVENAYSTLVHEFQHMINYSDFHRKYQRDPIAQPMDTWLNEAMSMSAEEMVFPGSAVPSRLAYYQRDYSQMITRGQSLLDFNNSLESYALSCLFATYLKDQTGGYEVFSRILEHFLNNEAAAVEAAVAGSGLDGVPFENITGAFRAALAMNDSSGLYGFQGDAALSSLRPLLYVNNNTEVKLRGGGAILIQPQNGSFHPSGAYGPHIRFTGIRRLTDGATILQKPAENTLVSGETHLLNASGASPFVWSSSNPAVATVDQNGLLTALAEGVTVITLNNALSDDTFELTVGAPTVVIKEKPAQVTKGLPRTLTVETRPAGAVVQWSSSNSTIAEIHPDTGLLTPKALGRVTITATLGTQADSFETEVIEKYVFQGLTVDYDRKSIDVIASVGMDELAGLVNGTLTGVDPSLSNGLRDWTIDLTTSVTLENYTSIGINRTVPFNGIFNGNNKTITFNSISSIPQLIGVFGVNRGILNDMNVVITGALGYTADNGIYAGGVAAINEASASDAATLAREGRILNPVVTITKTGELRGANNVGGVTGRNYNLVENAFVTNNGLIRSTSSPVGGVTGSNQGSANVTAVLNGATVHNNGELYCSDDVGAVVGLAQNWNNESSLIKGDLNVTISETGKITGSGFGTMSVGGVIGYNLGGKMDNNTKITIRIDGDITTTAGLSGGVMGEGWLNGNPTIAVTLGPDSTISNVNMNNSGLLFGEDVGGNSARWVYAVPYDSPHQAFPRRQASLNAAIKRIEYPRDTNPSAPIKISKENPTPVLNTDSTASPNGVFLRRNTLAGKKLTAIGAVDSAIFDPIDSLAQEITSSFSSASGYYDFELVSEGEIPITVPAYLTFEGTETPPPMEFKIIGNYVEETEAKALDHPTYDRDNVLIEAKNGRIASWTVERDGTPYNANLSVSPNTDLRKGFLLAQKGLYKITATANPLDGGAPVTLIRYVCVGGVPSIEVEGPHLTVYPSENWTNLKTRPNPQNLRIEPVTVKARATTIESYEVKKEGIQFKIYPIDLSKDTPEEKIVNLFQTGRYQITARGVGLPGAVTKYVNIDVDAPMYPSYVFDIPGSLEKSASLDTEIGRPEGLVGLTLTLPTENPEQSPIYAQYKLDDGSFQTATGLYVPIGPHTQKVTFKTVDAAGNESEEVVLRFLDEYLVSLTANPGDGGTVNGGGIYRANSSATIVAVPNEGYQFDCWTRDGAETPEILASTYTFTVTGDIGYTAHFSRVDLPPDMISLRYLAEEGGSILGDTLQEIERYTDGSPVQAVADEGYRFDGWDDGVQEIVRCDRSVPANLTVRAHFVKVDAPTPPSSGGSGNTSDPDWIMLHYLRQEGGVILGQTVQEIRRYGNGAMVRAVADEGFYFDGWSDGVNQETRRDLRVPRDLTVVAQFVRIPVEEEKEVPATGDGSPLRWFAWSGLLSAALLCLLLLKQKDSNLR